MSPNRELAYRLDKAEEEIELISKWKLENCSEEQMEALRQLKRIQPFLWSISLALKQPEASKELGSLDAGRKAFP